MGRKRKLSSEKVREIIGRKLAKAVEKQEFERAISAAKAQIELPENCPDWLERKLVAQAISAEFLATYPSTENGL